MNKFRVITLILMSSSLLQASSSLDTEYRTRGPALRDAFESVQPFLQASSAVIAKGRDEIVYGTVVSSSGHILTKASELPESISDLTVTVDQERYDNPVMLSMNPEWDVALIKIEADGLVPVSFDYAEEVERGTWLFANGATTRRKRWVQIGVSSANYREIFAEGGTVLGVGLKTEDDIMEVNSVTEGSGAEKAGLKEGDKLLTVDGEEIKEMETLLEMLSEKRVGDVIDVVVERDGEKITLPVELSARTDLFERKMTRNDSMSGEVSSRRTGFPMVMQHDIMGSAETMGGPVFDLQGHCVGMNIARFSRCETYAIPTKELGEIAKDMIGKTD